MREQLVLRICLAVAALVCLVTFVISREHIDLVAAVLFVLVTYSTGQKRSGAFLGAIGAGAAVLVIRVHQYLAGVMTLSTLLFLNLIFPLAVIILAVLAKRNLRKS